MIIIHQVDSFLEELFPELKGKMNNLKQVQDAIEKYYTFQNIKPTVLVNDGYVEVRIDEKVKPNLFSPSDYIEIHAISEGSPDLDLKYNKAIKLCEDNRFNEAIPILLNLIEKNPYNSEYYRNLGQAYSMIGDDDAGINYLIDALKWNPKNNYALIMVGNIFARNKNDIETAMKYYLQAIENNPNDAMAIHNLGTYLLQVGKVDEGLEFLMKAHTINPDYPNSLYGIASANQMKGNNQEAFSYALKSLKKFGKAEQELMKNAKQLLFESSREISKTDIGRKVFDSYHQYLQERTKKEIRVEVDNTLETAAKMEFAEYHKRDFHLVKYNQKYPSAHHLMMHELTHLELATDAREESCNKIFTTDSRNSKLFMENHKQHRISMHKQGLSEEMINNYFDSLFYGLNRQLFNAPIDLFIEDKLFNNFPDLQPFQFLSLYSMISGGVFATTDKKTIGLAPPSILFCTKVLNLLNALQFRDLFGVDLVSDFRPTVSETKMANKFYEEFYEYRDDKMAGEEYELVEHWGMDLKLDKYFEFVNEKDFHHKSSSEDILDKIERDPFDLESPDPYKEQQTELFKKNQQEMGLNMAVVMFMVDALQYFNGMSQEKIKEIAYEIAIQGTQGFNPENKNYSISLIPNKIFSGYHILAYYYVSWKLAIPEMLSQLQLPFDEEFKLASSMHNPSNK